MIDSPYKTLNLIRGLQKFTDEFRKSSRNKDYNSGEVFARISNKLNEEAEIVKDSIEGWEKIMNEG
jgi:hypothetical protein